MNDSESGDGRAPDRQAAPPSSTAGLLPVTVVIPVRNEERNLPACLAQLGGFAEVIVVDSSSTDGTRAIAAQHGARLVDFHWNGRFPKKRNWTLRTQVFRTPWVLFLDADERLSDAFKQELAARLPTTDCAGFQAHYDNWFVGRRLRHGDRMRKLPLFRIGAGEYEQIDEEAWSALDMEVHEHPRLQGRIGVLRTPIEHHDYRDLEAYLARHNAYSTWEARRFLALRRMGWAGLTARQKLKYRLLGTWLLAPFYFLGAYVLKGGLLDGKAGLKLALLKAGYFLVIKSKIDEMTTR